MKYFLHLTAIVKTHSILRESNRGATISVFNCINCSQHTKTNTLKRNWFTLHTYIHTNKTVFFKKLRWVKHITYRSGLHVYNTHSQQYMLVLRLYCTVFILHINWWCWFWLIYFISCHRILWHLSQVHFLPRQITSLLKIYFTFRLFFWVVFYKFYFVFHFFYQTPNEIESWLHKFSFINLSKKWC